jgi:hypothetical protein
MRRRLTALVVLLASCQARGRDGGEHATPAVAAPAVAPAAAITDGGLLSAAQLGERVAAVATGRLVVDQWFGLYVADKKVGWAHVVGQAAEAARPGEIVWSIDGTLVSGGNGERAEVGLQSRRYFRAAPPYRLSLLETREGSAEGEVVRRYRNGADGMVVDETIDGVARAQRNLPASAETAAGTMTMFTVEPSWLHAGQSGRFVEFAEGEERDIATTVRVVSVGRERLGGVDTLVASLRDQRDGETATTDTRLAAGAVTLGAAMGDGMRLVAEDARVAQRDVRGFDMVGDAVPVDQPLDQATTTGELHLLVRLPAGFHLRDAPNQTLGRRDDDRVAVTLRAIPGLPVMPAERRAALQPTADIDSDDPAVKSEAAAIVAGARDQRAAAHRLVHWVYGALDKDLATNLSTASQVLAHRAGDCTEHTLLLVALARAAGIPARELSGLMYMGDDVQRFGWHAWAELAIDGRWVMVDPTWDQDVASAGHLVLAVGDETDWVMTMGAIKITVDPGR